MMLVLLMESIYVVYCWDRFKWHDAHMVLHDDWLRYSSNIKGIN
jgi:hypothetical protein